MSDNDELKKKNLRTALILFSVVIVFLAGFVAKITLFGAS